jgi:putative Mg2+ transporter-C (MgtC) family protein
MESFSPLEMSFWIPVMVAVACGTVVGLERQLRGKPLDVRTAVLICLGTHVFIRLGVDLAGDQVDATRVLGQMVTGVGFLGAGVILTRGSHVVGLTTASVIWVLAGIGAAIGFGEYQAAIALSIVTFLVLTVMEWVEDRVEHMRRGAHAREKDDRRL